MSSHSSSNSSPSNVVSIFSKSSNSSNVSQSAKPTRGIDSGRVIKAGTVATYPPAYQPVPATKSNTPLTTSTPVVQAKSLVDDTFDLSSTAQSRLALDHLKQNFKELSSLQARFRFMLEELEQVVKE